MRRKPGALLPIERSILEAAYELRLRGQADFHGYGIAREVRDREAARRLTAHGTLYRALDRLLRTGMLEAEWEDPEIAVAEGRPRRRLYRITSVGELATEAQTTPAARPRLRRQESAS